MPPDVRADRVRRWARRSSASAYGVIEPLTSTSSTTRRGRVPRRRQAISPGSPRWRSELRRVRDASRSPRCQRRCRAVRRTGGCSDSRTNIAASRRFSAASSVATSRCWRTSASDAIARTTSSSSVSPAPPAPSASGSRCAVEARDGLALLGARQPVARVEPRREDLVVAGEVVGRPAERGPAGPVGRLPVVGADGRHRRQEAVGPVLGDRHAGGTERAGEAEEHLVGVVEGGACHRESIRSSAARTRSASSRYFSRAPRVAAADARSRSAVPR